MGKPTFSLEERFWAKVDRHGPDECWGWLACCNPFGYGRIGLGGKKGRIETAHRVSWMLHRGNIPPGMCVCHRCDNPPCTNPAHLFLGTMTENNRDMWAKGRGKVPDHRGEQCYQATLTDDQVRDIRSRPALSRYGELAALAREFGVSGVTMHRILTRRIWSHVI